MGYVDYPVKYKKLEPLDLVGHLSTIKAKEIYVYIISPI